MYYISNELIAGSIILILTYIVTYTVLKKFIENKWSVKTIAIVISLMAFRYLTYEQINYIINLYGTTAAIMLIIFPTTIVFFFIYSISLTPILRKGLWVLYGAIIFFLAGTNENIPLEAKNKIISFFLIAITLIIIFDTFIKNKLNQKEALKGI